MKHNRRESDMGGERYDDQEEQHQEGPDYEALFNDRREQKARDLEYDPTLNR